MRLLAGAPAIHLAPRTLAKLGECILAHDWHLAWTQRSVMACGFSLSSANKLGIRSPPLLQVVCEHAQSLGKRGNALLDVWPCTGLLTLVVRNSVVQDPRVQGTTLSVQTAFACTPLLTAP